MLSRGADPDAQDTNGNTVLHLLVIYQKLVNFYKINYWCEAWKNFQMQLAVPRIKTIHDCIFYLHIHFY